MRELEEKRNHFVEKQYFRKNGNSKIAEIGKSGEFLGTRKRREFQVRQDQAEEAEPFSEAVFSSPASSLLPSDTGAVSTARTRLSTRSSDQVFTAQRRTGYSRRVLIYLHGLNSSGRSHKAGVLRQKLAPTPVLAPTYPAHRPDEAVGQLSAFFDGTTRKSPRVTPVVVGSSMGGFYGQFLARRFAVAHLFLINPALTPWTLLADYLGQAMTTADGEAYRITPEMLHRTRSYAIDDPCDGTPTTLFLDEGDEVIDYRIAQALYRQCARLEVFEGGDHSFAHMDDAVSLIRVSLQGLV